VYTVTDKGRHRLEVDLHQWETFRQGMSLLLGLEKTQP
jgi:DNA-binding PadR family transcriptional regulator